MLIYTTFDGKVVNLNQMTYCEISKVKDVYQLIIYFPGSFHIRVVAIEGTEIECKNELDKIIHGDF